MKKNIVFVMAGVAILLVIVLVAANNRSNRTAFFDEKKVFAGFKLKQELQQQLEQAQLKRYQVIDSLKLTIQQLQDDISVTSDEKNNEVRIKEYNALLQQYISLKENSSQRDVEEIQIYDKQILTQLRQYVSDYAESKGYSYLLVKKEEEIGYFDPDQDVTNEVITYVNQRYEGSSK